MKYEFNFKLGSEFFECSIANDSCNKSQTEEFSLELIVSSCFCTQ